MTGEYKHSIDNKGRLFIPAKLRDELGDVFYITLSMDDCLSVYSAESWKEFSDKVNAMSYIKQRKMRPLFAYAAKCELDNQGRTLIPAHLREYAHLSKNVAVIGCNNHAEIWDDERWQKLSESEITPENIASVMDDWSFDMSNEAKHISVLLNECIENLNIKPDGIYVDGTLGLGGHSEQILKRLDTGRLIGIDRDESAIRRTGERLAKYADKMTLVHGNFCDVSQILDELGVDAVDGMLFDLGVSSPQLDEAERGFSYMNDAPLDMRMDNTSALTASNVVNDWDEAELVRILRDFGEERYARRIASRIVERREQKKIETTLELVDIIRSAMPAAALREKQHPAKRSFQAIRIAVNDELGAVDRMMKTAPDRLKKGGRLCVISFHSLEDRIVKTGIAARENGCTCPREAPICVCGFKQTLRSVHRKPIVPDEDELNFNPRARSAKLRVAERV